MKFIHILFISKPNPNPKPKPNPNTNPNRKP